MCGVGGETGLRLVRATHGPRCAPRHHPSRGRAQGDRRQAPDSKEQSKPGEQSILGLQGLGGDHGAEWNPAGRRLRRRQAYPLAEDGNGHDGRRARPEPARDASRLGERPSVRPVDGDPNRRGRGAVLVGSCLGLRRRHDRHRGRSVELTSRQPVGHGAQSDDDEGQDEPVGKGDSSSKDTKCAGRSCPGALTRPPHRPTT